MTKQTRKLLALLCAGILCVSLSLAGCGEDKNGKSSSAKSGATALADKGDPELCTLCPDPDDCCFCYQYGDCECDSEDGGDRGGNEDGDNQSGGNTGNSSKKSGSAASSVSSKKTSGGNNSGGSKTNYTPSLNGKTITILREWGPYESGKNTAHDNWNKRVAELESKYKCDIVEKAWSATLLQESMAAVKPAGNLYQTLAGSVWSLASAGYIADWNAAMKTTGIDMTSDVFHPFNVEMCNLNSKQYAVGIEEARIDTGILFNRKLVDEFGDIYKLIENKQWTWDKLTEIAKKVKAKYPDKYGIGMNNGVAAALAISNGSSLVAIDKNGKTVSNLNSEPVKEALQKIYDWCNVDKVVTYNYGQLGWNTLDKEFANGNIAFFFNGESALSLAANSFGENDYGFGYLPMGPRMKEYRAAMVPAYPYVLPNAYKENAADYLFLINELYALQPGYTKDDQFRDLWIRKFKSAKAYNYYKSMNREIKFGFVSPAVLGSEANTWNSVIGKLFQGTVTTGVLVDTYHTEFNNVLSDKWKNLKFTGKVQ